MTMHQKIIPVVQQAGPSDGKLEYREARPDDLDLIRELHAAVGYPPRSRGFDHWRYVTCPQGACPGVLAMDGDRAAGFYTVWPVRMKLGSQAVLGAQSMDTMTHPDYRGRGLFVALARECYALAASKGYDVLYGFPNGNSYPGFIRRLNWDHTGDIVHWIRPVRPSGLRAVPRALGPLADLGTALWPRGRSGGYEVTVGRPATAGLEALLATWCDERDVCRIERDPAWLDWRYAAEAEKNYEWVCAYKGGELRAAAVWGMPNASWSGDGHNRARIGELLGDDSGAREAVVRTVIRRAGTRGAALLEMMCNVEPVTATLKRAGFFRYRRAPFIARALRAVDLGGNIHNHAAWRITGGDWDGS